MTTLLPKKFLNKLTSTELHNLIYSETKTCLEAIGKHMNDNNEHLLLPMSNSLREIQEYSLLARKRNITITRQYTRLKNRCEITGKFIVAAIRKGESNGNVV